MVDPPRTIGEVEALRGVSAPKALAVKPFNSVKALRAEVAKFGT